MKNIGTAIAVTILSTVGFVGAATAGAAAPLVAPTTLNCGDEEYVCIGADLYEAKLNCDGLTPDTDDLAINTDPGFTLDVADSDPVFDCHLAGDIDQKKTEVKCTEADKGPNKTVGSGNGQNQNHTTGDLQADAEIKLIFAGSLDCPPPA